MSEIYSPGSIAGPQGSAGAAGSQGSVTALASSLLPVSGNLFDAGKIVVGHYVNPADGTLIAAGGIQASSGLIFCPGATSAVCNIPIDFNLGCIALYDANGSFIGSRVQADFPGKVTGGPNDMQALTAFALPGTQVYIRFCWQGRWGDPYASSAATAAFYATTSGTAGWLGYQPAGLDTVAAVNAKDAVVAGNAAAALVAMAGGIGTALELFARTVLPSPYGSNAFDSQKVLHNTSISPLGVPTASGGNSSVMVFAPGATQFTTNLPIRGTGNGYGFCLYDTFGNFLEEVSAEFGGSLIIPGNVYTLPGTQTFLMFTYNSANFGWGPESNGTYFSASDLSALFLVGTAASPCPTSLPAGAPHYSAPTVHVKTASQLGAASDASYDSAGIINAFLATASSSNPIKLILDGIFAIATSLVISPAGYTTIEGIGWGSGLNVLNDTYSVVIGTQTQGAYNVVAPARTAKNIDLRNFTVTGAGNCHIAMMVSSCSDVIVENLNFPGTTAGNDFMVTLANANRVSVRGCSFASVGTSHDGIHVNGLCEDITISDCYFATGDDAIALNAPEGYGGDISRVAVTNCIFDGSLTVMRAYTSIDAANMPTNNTHRIRNVVVSNCVGVTRAQCFNIGITDGGLSATAAADQLQDFSVSNCTLSSPLGLALLFTPIGSIAFSNVRFIPTGTAAVIGVWLAIGELVLDGVTVLRNPDGSSSPLAFVSTLGGSAIDRLSLQNCRVVDEVGSSYAAVPCMLDIGGTVAALRLESTDMTHITALTSGVGWAGVTRLLGSGVMGTGTAVPDSVMGNNLLYLSSNAGGAPSIKVGGTAKRLTFA